MLEHTDCYPILEEVDGSRQTIPEFRETPHEAEQNNAKGIKQRKEDKASRPSPKLATRSDIN